MAMNIAEKSLLSLLDTVLHEGRVALLCNQTSWDFTEGTYLFELLHKRGTLHRMFMPEHGLFAELQDQEALDSGEFYKCLGLDGVDFVSLYGATESSLSAPIDKLRDLDAIIIDLQDVGCRYYTFICTVDKLFRSLIEHGLNLTVYVIDRPNPAGRQVEGTYIGKEYTSFIGVEGLIHRHGLTFGELCWFLHGRHNAKFPLTVIPYTLDVKYKISYTLPGAGTSYVKTPCSIYPSPNIPSPYTCLVYSGQCLFEGTNLSEGRGTTRPFEIFGAPFLGSLHYYNRTNGYTGWNDKRNPTYSDGAMLRMLHFIPTFHKYAGELCYGFQLHLTGKPYHSLLHTLRILRFLRENVEGFAWRDGVYEKGNDKIAIELLVGDSLLLDYLNGKASEQEVYQALADGEEQWMKEAYFYTIYREKFERVVQEKGQSLIKKEDVELRATSISYELDNGEGLSYLLFEYLGGYFAIAKMQDEDEIVYLEKNDRSNGQYWECDYFELSLRNGKLVLSLNLNINDLWEYINANKLNVELYSNTAIVFEPMPIEEFEEFEEVVKLIFG